MGAKDTKAKEFLSNNERFADVFNYYMFDGKSVIKPEDLQEKDTTEVISLYGIDGKEMQKQKWRDLLKSAIIKKTEGIIYVLLGAENQSDIHYAMPVKNMIYDMIKKVWFLTSNLIQKFHDRLTCDHVFRDDVILVFITA